MAEAPSSPDDPSELMEPHASREGVGIDGSQMAYSVNPRTSKETAEERTARQKEIISTCVKACTMPLCVKACHAIADPEKLNDLVFGQQQSPPLQQAASRPDQGWQSFIKKCEDSCKIDSCREMCRAAGAKTRNSEMAVMHYDPATTDEATGQTRDTAAEAAHLAPILAPPLPKGIDAPADETMMARVDGDGGGEGDHVVEQAPTQQLAEVCGRRGGGYHVVDLICCDDDGWILMPRLSWPRLI